jgi:hypothetical protein
MHPDDMTRTATPSEAHAEWHLNAGVPMGTPGCPQDACHPVDDDYGVPETATGPRCGNRAMHGTETVHHATAADVRDCFDLTKGSTS